MTRRLALSGLLVLVQRFVGLIQQVLRTLALLPICPTDGVSNCDLFAIDLRLNLFHALEQ